LVQAIQTKLTGKARQVVRYQTFETWEQLRDLLKSTTKNNSTFISVHVRKETKIRNGNFYLYSKEVEVLQNTIIEVDNKKI